MGDLFVFLCLARESWRKARRGDDPSGVWTFLVAALAGAALVLALYSCGMI